MRHRLAVRTGLVLAALLAVGMAAGAQEPGGGPGQFGPGFGGHRPPMERALGPRGGIRWWNDQATIERLKLTDDQRKGMDQVLQQHEEKLIDLRANLEKSELTMRPLMSADQPDENAILAQIDKVAAARAELEKANARFLLAIRGKLTPDQWKELQTMRSERPAPKEWRGNGAGPNGQNRRTPPPSGGAQGAPSGPPDGNGGPQSRMNGAPPPPPDGDLEGPEPPAPGDIS